MAISLYHGGEASSIELLEGISGQAFEHASLSTGQPDTQPDLPPRVTLQIDGGRKQKIRPGDLLGALTGENGIAGSQVGKINIFEQTAFVAVDRDVCKRALGLLQNGKVKGRSFRARRIKS